MMSLARAPAAFKAATKAAPAPRTLVVRVRAQQKQAPKVQLPELARPAIATVVANVLMALPAAAEGGKLFDFNLTLPVMAGEILLLMVFLDKFWFGPVGKVLDERDSTLRSQLGSVKDNTSELDKLTAEAAALVKEARAEVSALVNKSKGEKQAELDKIYADAKGKLQAETDAAIAVLEKESESLLKSLDAQAEKISDQVLKRVLPEGVRV